MNEQPTSSADANFSAPGSGVDQREVSQPKPLNREKVTQAFNALLTDVSIPASLRDATEDLLDGLGAMDPLQMTEAWLKTNPVTAELTNANRKLEVQPDGSLQIVRLAAPIEAAAAPVEPIVAPSTPLGVKIEPNSIATEVPVQGVMADDKTLILNISAMARPDQPATDQPPAELKIAAEVPSLKSPAPAEAPAVVVAGPAPSAAESVPATPTSAPAVEVKPATPETVKPVEELWKDLETAKDMLSMINTLKEMNSRKLNFNVPSPLPPRDPKSALGSVEFFNSLAVGATNTTEKPVSANAVSEMLEIYNKRRFDLTNTHQLRDHVDLFMQELFPTLKTQRDAEAAAKVAKPAVPVEAAKPPGKEDVRTPEDLLKEISTFITKGQVDEAKVALDRNALKLAAVYSETNQKIEQLRIAQSVMLNRFQNSSAEVIIEGVKNFHSAFPEAQISFKPTFAQEAKIISPDNLQSIILFDQNIEGTKAANDLKKPDEAKKIYNLWAWYTVPSASITHQFTSELGLRYKLVAYALVRLDQDIKWQDSAPPELPETERSLIQQQIDKLRGVPTAEASPAQQPTIRATFASIKETVFGAMRRIGQPDNIDKTKPE